MPHIFQFPFQSLSLQYRDPSLRQVVHQLIYDEVLSAVLRITNRLDLSSKSAAVAAAEQEVSLLHPSTFSKMLAQNRSGKKAHAHKWNSFCASSLTAFL